MSITPYPNMADVTDGRGASPVAPSQFANTNGKGLVVLHTGQSMPSNYGALDYYSPWTGGVFEFCGDTGLIYPSDGWAVRGTNGDGQSGVYVGRLSILPYFYDLAVANGLVDWVLMCVMNAGGTSAGDWSPAGQCFPRIQSTLEQLAALGIAPNYMFHTQGQQDVYLQTSQSVYASAVEWMFEGVRGLGFDGTIVVEQGAYWPGYSDVNPAAYQAIIAGQAQAATSGVAPNLSLGFNDDTYTGSLYRYESEPHWNTNGRYYACQGKLATIPKLAA